MSVDIMQQIAFVRQGAERSERLAKRFREAEGLGVLHAEKANVWRAILATLERVAAEERPERMQ